MYAMGLKRIFDVSFAGILLIILSPILALISLIIKIREPHLKIFFTQPRVGHRETVFYLLKFRTMNNRCDETGKLLDDHARLTKLGKVLRKTSLDEIPQLINILRGEMSLVGPRPLLVEYLSKYNLFQRQRHNVKLGLTGLAQINGRNAISWKEKFEYDVEYVKNVSFKNDLLILLGTIKKVFQQADISADDHATMKPFEGSTEDDNP